MDTRDKANKDISNTENLEFVPVTEEYDEGRVEIEIKRVPDTIMAIARQKIQKGGETIYSNWTVFMGGNRAVEEEFEKEEEIMEWIERKPYQIIWAMAVFATETVMTGRMRAITELKEKGE